MLTRSLGESYRNFVDTVRSVFKRVLGAQCDERCVSVVPVSIETGENIVSSSVVARSAQTLAFYADTQPSLLDLLLAAPRIEPPPVVVNGAPALRFISVSRFASFGAHASTTLCGRVVSGELRCGDELVVDRGRSFDVTSLQSIGVALDSSRNGVSFCAPVVPAISTSFIVCCVSLSAFAIASGRRAPTRGTERASC